MRYNETVMEEKISRRGFFGLVAGLACTLATSAIAKKPELTQFGRTGILRYTPGQTLKTLTPHRYEQYQSISGFGPGRCSCGALTDERGTCLALVQSPGTDIRLAIQDSMR